MSITTLTKITFFIMVIFISVATYEKIRPHNPENTSKKELIVNSIMGSTIGFIVLFILWIITFLIKCLFETLSNFTESKTRADIARLTLTLALIPATIYTIFLTIDFSISSRIWEIPTTTHHLKIILPLTAACCLMSSIIPSFAAYKKGGFSSLNNRNENGIIKGLTEGSQLGLVFGIFFCIVIFLHFISITPSTSGLINELLYKSIIISASILIVFSTAVSVVRSVIEYREEF